MLNGIEYNKIIFLETTLQLTKSEIIRKLIEKECEKYTNE